MTGNISFSQVTDRCLHLEGGNRTVKKNGSVGWISRKLRDLG